MYGYICICHILFIQSSVDGLLSWSYLLAIMDNVAVNMSIINISSRPYFEFFSACGLARSHSNETFDLLRNCLTVFHSGNTVLCSCQQCTRIPVSPIFSLKFVFSFLLLILLLFFFFLSFIFDNNRPNGCEVVSHFSLICFSLMISDTEHLFMCLLAIYIVFRKMWGSWCIS